MSPLKIFFSCTLMLIFSLKLSAQDLDKTKAEIIQQLDQQMDHYGQVAHQIWGFAEMGYQEHQSTQLLQKTLKDAGFSIEAGVADMPTAFVASWGSGKPIIGILAEFDALPGLAQEAFPERKAIDGQKAGHACGHHLFGTGSTAAAIAVKNWLEESGTKGTIRLYGTPAEEGGGGKVYMVREGLFDDVDAVINWHPGSGNQASAGSSLAVRGIKFRFHGKASHAAGSPEQGRSALDGVEAFTTMVNLMREHVPDATRIHYVISRGGEAPNVVPAFAEVILRIRHPDVEMVKSIYDRIVLAAKGAAMGTGTTMTQEIYMGYYNLLPNEPLAEKMYENLKIVGGVTYNEEEQQFAQKIIGTLDKKGITPDLSQEIESYSVSYVGRGGSTDVGDISWQVPTVGMSAATWVPGTSAHSWQAVAAGGTSIGTKGMMVAAKAMTITAIDLYKDQSIIERAKAKLNELRGEDFKYESLVGDRKPPLDYRSHLTN